MEASGEVGIVPLVDFANCAAETWIPPFSGLPWMLRALRKAYTGFLTGVGTHQPGIYPCFFLVGLFLFCNLR